MSWEFELVAGPYGETTEGPAWDGQALLFTHIIESRIMRYDPQTGSCTEHRTGTHRTNGLAFDSSGNLYGCCSGRRSNYSIRRQWYQHDDRRPVGRPSHQYSQRPGGGQPGPGVVHQSLEREQC